MPYLHICQLKALAKADSPRPAAPGLRLGVLGRLSRSGYVTRYEVREGEPLWAITPAGRAALSTEAE